MRSVLRALGASVTRLLERPREVDIERCYHFRGYRYGGFGNNPYEDYIVGLAQGQDPMHLRRSFADLMLCTGPKTMGEALDIDIAHVPPWHFPWGPAAKQGWAPIGDPAANPDIVCHYCAAGVLASHINREFGWLESSLRSIKSQGYRPQEFGYIRCLRFDAGERSSYLVLDGNHRISAMHAVGLRRARVKVLPWVIRRAKVDRWARVRDGSYDRTSALRVFDRYFADVNPPLRRLNPVPLVVDEVPAWTS